MEGCSGTYPSFVNDVETRDVSQNISVIQSKNAFFTIAGILEFLQVEWSKMEVERSQWEVERTELQTRIAFLQGEFKGQENLKNDLIRRIKMLEYALIQERNKNFETKYPNEIKLSIPVFNDTESVGDIYQSEDFPKSFGLMSSWRTDQNKIKEYFTNTAIEDAFANLREYQISDIFETKSSNEVSLTNLGAGKMGHKTEEINPNITQEQLNQLLNDMSHKINTSASVEHDKTCDPERNFPSNEINNGISSVHESGLALDSDTVEALAEFDRLVAQQTYVDPNSVQSHQSSHSPSTDIGFTNNDELDEKEKINSFKEHYETDRLRSHQSSHSSSTDVGSSRKDVLDEKERINRLKEQYEVYRLRATVPRLTNQSLLVSVPKPYLDQNDVIYSDRKNEYLTSIIEGDINVKHPEKTSFQSLYVNGNFGQHDLDEVVPDFDVILNDSKQFVPQNEAVNPTSSETSSKTPVGSSKSGSSPLGLGDLANLTVSSESDSNVAHAVAVAMDNLDGVGEYITGRKDVQSNLTNSSATPQKITPWTAKYTLRSHFDAIRSICFHPIEPVLVTCSEDHTLKLWNLNKTIRAKKSTVFDVEPIYTFRGHESPVLALTMFTNLSNIDSTSNLTTSVGTTLSSGPLLYVYSGDLNGKLHSWLVPNLQLDPYDTFDPSMIGSVLGGHTDAIWSLCTRPDGLLLSTSADGTSRLWKIGSPQSLRSSSATYHIADMLKKVNNPLIRDIVPTSAMFSASNASHFVVGFTSGHIGLFDLEKNQLLTKVQATDFKSDVYSTHDNSQSTFRSNNTAVISVASHPRLPFVISAHEDRRIRYFDFSSGKCIHSTVAHSDAVTALCIDPKGSTLLSASHDCSIRLWDVNNLVRIQEITSHHKKFGESVHAVSFHPTKHFMASAGSDALAKVFV